MPPYKAEKLLWAYVHQVTRFVFIKKQVKYNLLILGIIMKEINKSCTAKTFLVLCFLFILAKDDRTVNNG